MRAADRAALGLGALALAFAGCLVDASLHASTADSQASAQLVAQLRLTDLALFTEARYTRHPSQADLHSAFQDHPLAFEHFPTGSLIGPPPHLREIGTKVGAGGTALRGNAAPP